MKTQAQPRLPGFDMMFFPHYSQSPFNVSNPRDLDSQFRGNAEKEWETRAREAGEYELDARGNSPAGNVTPLSMPTIQYHKYREFLKEASELKSSKFDTFTDKKVALLVKYFPGQFKDRNGLAKDALKLGSQFYHLITHAEALVGVSKKK